MMDLTLGLLFYIKWHLLVLVRSLRRIIDPTLDWSDLVVIRNRNPERIPIKAIKHRIKIAVDIRELKTHQKRRKIIDVWSLRQDFQKCVILDIFCPVRPESIIICSSITDGEKWHPHFHYKTDDYLKRGKTTCAVHVSWNQK